MNIVLLGLPGSGKGTQAVLIAKKYNLFYLATGDISREWATKDARIKEIVDSGMLIPEKEMTEFVMDYLNKNVNGHSGILFEGFPRFISQFDDYEAWLAKKNEKVDYVFYLEISENRAVERMSSRRICANCGSVFNIITEPPKTSGKCDKCGGDLIQRKDDNSEAIKVRYESFLNNTQKLIDHLKKQGRVIVINADQSVEKVFADIDSNIKV